MIDVKAKHYVFDSESTVLEQIREPGINLAVWERDLDKACPGFSAWMDHLSLEQIPNQRFIAVREKAEGVIREVCEESLPDTPERDFLINDICIRVDQMFEFTGEEYLKIRIDRFDEASCPRFHQDAVGVRLLCTYRGPGTEWVPNDAVTPNSLGLGLENSEIVSDSTTVSQFSRYAVGFLKGSNSPEGTYGIVHRSPDAPLRLLLCVEPVHPKALEGILKKIKCTK